MALKLCIALLAIGSAAALFSVGSQSESSSATLKDPDPSDIDRSTVYLMDVQEPANDFAVLVSFQVSSKDHGGFCSGTAYYQDGENRIRRIQFDTDKPVKLSSAVKTVLVEPACEKCAYALIQLNGRPGERLVISVKPDKGTRLSLNLEFLDDADHPCSYICTVSPDGITQAIPNPELLNVIDITVTDALGVSRGFDWFRARPIRITSSSFTILNPGLSKRLPKSSLIRIDMKSGSWRLVQTAKATEEMVFTLPKEK